MGAAGRRKDASVEGRLRAEPHRFEFFQAVRLLHAVYGERALRDRRWEREAVGHDAHPSREVVRFRAHQSLSFPPGEVADLEQPRPEGVEEEWKLPPLDMTVSFLGLTGPEGSLPDHYSAAVIARMRNRDHALRRFLDLFNHRAVSLFYRAWGKYRLPSGYEASAGGRQEHFPTWCLFALVGLGTEGLRSRSRVLDEAFVYYGGLYSHDRTDAVSLQRMLAAYFDTPVEVLQFEGEWLYLRPEDRTVLPSPGEPLGRHNRLGENTVLGEQVWDVRGNFAIRLGPMSYAAYRGFMPEGRALAELHDLVRTALGPGLGFVAQPVVEASEVPECMLDSNASDPLTLGANVWLRSVPCEEDFDGARFTPV